MNFTTPTKPARTASAQMRNTYGDLLTGSGLKDVLASSRRYAMTMPDSAATTPALPTSVPTWAADSNAYTCPELRNNPYRPGSGDAFRLPSLTSFRTPQPA